MARPHVPHPGDGFLGDYARAKQHDAPVGLPEPRLFTGAADAEDQQAKQANANVPVENYQSFLDGNQKLEMKIEPPHANSSTPSSTASSPPSSPRRTPTSTSC